MFYLYTHTKLLRLIGYYAMAADKTKEVLTWKERLQIALDAAQGSESKMIIS